MQANNLSKPKTAKPDRPTQPQKKQETTPPPQKTETETTQSPKKTEQETTQPPKKKTYIVKENDTLYSICKRFGCNADDVRRWNKLKGNTIFIGQELRLE